MGKQKDVVLDILRDPRNKKKITQFEERLATMNKSPEEYIVAFGCDIGCHRSVVLADHFAQKYCIVASHRDLPKI